MWSVVTPVPAGTHEFKFVVDGEWKHSTRHPTVGEDDETTNNIRVIRGPPKNKQNTARLSEQRNKDAGVTTNKHKKCSVVSFHALQKNQQTQYTTWFKLTLWPLFMLRQLWVRLLDWLLTRIPKDRDGRSDLFDEEGVFIMKLRLNLSTLTRVYGSTFFVDRMGWVICIDHFMCIIL